MEYKIYCDTCDQFVGTAREQLQFDKLGSHNGHYLRLESYISPIEGVKVTKGGLYRIVHGVIDMVLRKNADYGDAWQRQGGCGWALRLADKLCRVERLADGKEALVLDENIRDSLRDAIGYSLLGLLWLEEMEE